MKTFTPPVMDPIQGPNVKATMTKPVMDTVSSLDMDALNQLLDQRFSGLQDTVDKRLTKMVMPEVDYNQIGSLIDDRLSGLTSQFQPGPGIDYNQIGSLIDERLGGLTGSFQPPQSIDYNQIGSMLDERLGGLSSQFQPGPSVDYNQIGSMLDERMGGLSSQFQPSPSIDYGQIGSLIDERMGGLSGIEESIAGLRNEFGSIAPPSVDLSRFESDLGGLRDQIGGINTAIQGMSFDPSTMMDGLNEQIQAGIDAGLSKFPTMPDIDMTGIQNSIENLRGDVGGLNVSPEINYDLIRNMIGEEAQAVIDGFGSGGVGPAGNFGGGLDGVNSGAVTPQVSNPNPIITPNILNPTTSPNPAPNPNPAPTGGAIDWNRYGRDGGEAILYNQVNTGGPAGGGVGGWTPGGGGVDLTALRDLIQGGGAWGQIP
ncbi:MAG: hypothetical protein P1U43_13915 [Maricaulis sp.]|nr:hypothetical protein [Maricaulis sp.]